MDFATIPLENLVLGLKNEEIDLLDYLQSSSNLTEDSDKNIQALLPEKNRLDRLIAEGKSLKKQFPEKNGRPPFYGVLFGVKDIINVDGFPTKAGSKLPPHLFEGLEAPIVEKIKKTGGIVLGKTVTTEFAFLDPGPTRNPLNLEHTPGGSSSGSAAAVAAGYCPIAIGTQTIGSVIRPGAFCGVIGYKPTQGWVSNEGIVPLAKTLDQVGFFSRRIEDMEFFFCSIVREQGTEESKFSDKLKIGVQGGNFLKQASPEIIKDFKEIVELLKKKLEVKPADVLGEIEKINNNLFDLLAGEKAITHERWYSQYKDLYSEKISESIEKGLEIDKKRLEEIRQYRMTFRAELESRMRDEGIEILISPSTAEYPPGTIKSTGNPIMNAPWTFAGFPVLSIPVAIEGQSFPFGLQIIGPMGSDYNLFRAAKVFSKALS